MITRPPRTICIGSLSSFEDFLLISFGELTRVCVTGTAFGISCSDGNNVGVSMPLDANGSGAVDEESTSEDYIRK